MEHLLSLLDPINLKTALQSQNVVLVRDFARFLAAYYLNLPDILSSQPTTSSSATNTLPQNSLPNLFAWLNLAESEEFHSDGTSESRVKLASHLPHEYTPSTVLQLLCHSGNWLEALLFADHFNDFKSQLILRHMLDQNHSLELVKEHCQNCLINGILESIQDFTADDSSQILIARIQTIANVVVQLDVIFHTQLLSQMIGATVEVMQEELQVLLLRQWVDPLVQLPRPPIFMMPSESSPGVFELVCWNKVFHLLQVLITFLSTSNHLHPLIARTTLWLSNFNPHFTPELAYYLESEVDERDHTSEEYLHAFDKILVSVLKVDLRDRICLLQRTIEAQNDTTHIDREIHYLQSKYSALLTKESEEDEQEVFQRWLEDCINDTDIEFLLTFLTYLQGNNPRTERYRYLPPLTPQTQQQWSSVLMTQVTMKHKATARKSIQATTSLIDEEHKIKISTKDWLKVQFLAHQLPAVLLFDPSLVPISLRLEPTDFALPYDDVLGGHISHFHPEDVEAIEPLPIKEKPSPNPNTTGNNLLVNIRASISRLSSIKQPEVNSQKSNQRKDSFDVLMHNFHLRKIQEEIEKEKIFLKQHNIDQQHPDVGNTPVLGHLKWLDMQSRLHIISQQRALSIASSSRSRSTTTNSSSIQNTGLKEEIDKIALRLSKIQEDLHIESTKSKRFSSRNYSTHNTGKSVGKRMQISVPSNRPIGSESEQVNSGPPSSAGYYSSDDRSSNAISFLKKREKKRTKLTMNSSRHKENLATPPSQPTANFRLDFSALDSSPERRKKTQQHKQWTDLEIYPRQETIDQGKIRPNNLPSIKNKSSAEIQQLVKNTQKYPDWLRLLPDQFHSPDSSKYDPKSEPRLLRLPKGADELLKEGLKKTKHKSARDENTFYRQDQGMTRSDSGFIEQPGQTNRKTHDLVEKTDNCLEEADKVVFSCEMTQEQIDKLLNEFNDKQMRNY